MRRLPCAGLFVAHDRAGFDPAPGARLHSRRRSPVELAGVRTGEYPAAARRNRVRQEGHILERMELPLIREQQRGARVEGGERSPCDHPHARNTGTLRRAKLLA